MRIILNGRGLDTTKETLTYAEVITLAHGKQAAASPNYLVTFRSVQRAGFLSTGEKVDLLEGMIFNATIAGAA